MTDHSLKMGVWSILQKTGHTQKIVEMNESMKLTRSIAAFFVRIRAWYIARLAPRMAT